MSIFKNANETAYVGGRKHFTDVIKNSGDGKLLIWRQPEEDFNTNSTLIVMPGEEAIFVNNGNIERIFSSGRYKLDTQNYPFISRLRNAFSGGVSTFNCVVYFVRKAMSMELHWGTDSPIQVRDPIFQIACDLRARGSYAVCVENSEKFLTNLIGNNIDFATMDSLRNFFRGQFLMHIKSNLAKVVKDSGEEIIGINSKQEELASKLFPVIENIIFESGLALQSFSIESIDVVDNENRRKLEKAISDRSVMGILGDNWEKQKQFELMSEAVQNGGNGFAGMGANFGVGLGIGGAFGQMANGIFGGGNGNGGFASGTAVNDPMNTPAMNNQPAAVSNAPSQPDASQHQQQQSPMEVLKQMKQLLDNGLISQSDYDKKVAEVLARM